MIHTIFPSTTLGKGSESIVSHGAAAFTRSTGSRLSRMRESAFTRSLDVAAMP